MQSVTTIGLDIAKSVFQVHGIDTNGQVVIRRQLKRRYVLASFRSSPLARLASRPVRHRTTGRASYRLWVTLFTYAAGYVKPYVKRQKNDAADAEAICEAVPEPTCGLCPPKRRAAGLSDASPHTASVYSPADRGDQFTGT